MTKFRADHPAKLQLIIQWSLLILLALMPFHAFFSVWLGSLTGHQTLIQAWKEMLLLLLGAASVALVIRDRPRLQRLRQPWIIMTAAFAAIALLVTVVTMPDLVTIIFGLKTDLEFLAAGIIAVLVASPLFMKRAVITILAGSGVVIGFGLLQIFVLPPEFLTRFGYGPGTIVPYQYITAGTDALRFPATLGGPNQLGTYLILPLCLSLAIAIRYRTWWLLALPGAGILVLVATHSRSAWLGATAALAITLLLAIPAQRRRLAVFTLAGLGATAALILIPAAFDPNGRLQYYLLHSSVATHDQKNSDTEHAASLKQGIQSLAQTPFGHGLGTAGPATIRTDSHDRIIENYYLQVGYETGIIGMSLFIGVIVAIVKGLWRRLQWSVPNGPTGAAIVGVSLVALVLPAWTDSSTALIAWICAGAIMGLKRGATSV